MIGWKKHWKIYLFSLLTVFYFFYVFRNAIISDPASFFLEAKDIAAGNWALVGWNLSTVNFYFTEMIPFAIAIKLFGPHVSLLWLIPAAYYALVMVLSFSIAKRNKFGMAVLFIMALPCTFAVFTTIDACIHIGALIIALITINSMQKQPGAIAIALLAILNAMAIFSDSLYFYFMTVPLLVSLLAWPVLFKDRVKYKWLLMTILSVVIAFVMNKILSAIPHFYIQGYTPPEFVAIDKFWSNVYYMYYGLVHLFGADFYGKPIGDVSTLKNFFRFICTLSVLVFGIFYSLRTKSAHIIDRLLIVSIMVLAVAFVFSNMPVDIRSVRYLVPLVFMLLIFIARNVVINRQSVLLVLIPSFLIFLVNLSDWKTEYRDSAYVKVAKYIDSHDLGSGFGSFWLTTSVSIHSKNAISIAPTIVEEQQKRLRPYHWLSNEQWYTIRARYYIASSDEEVAAMSQVFGKDYRLEIVSGIRLMIYPDARIFTSE